MADVSTDAKDLGIQITHDLFLRFGKDAGTYLPSGDIAFNKRLTDNGIAPVGQPRPNAKSHEQLNKNYYKSEEDEDQDWRDRRLTTGVSRALATGPSNDVQVHRRVMSGDHPIADRCEMPISLQVLTLIDLKSIADPPTRSSIATLRSMTQNRYSGSSSYYSSSLATQRTHSQVGSSNATNRVEEIKAALTALGPNADRRIIGMLEKAKKEDRELTQQEFEEALGAVAARTVVQPDQIQHILQQLVVSRSLHQDDLKPLKVELQRAADAGQMTVTQLQKTVQRYLQNKSGKIAQV